MVLSHRLSSPAAMVLHETEVIAEQTHKLDASHHQLLSGDINVSLHESSLRVKGRILSIIPLMNESRMSYESTLSETLTDSKTHVEKSQYMVDAIYLRYLELSRSMASQVQLMKINGTFNSSGLADAVNCNFSISEASQNHLVILPEHFSRRDLQQKMNSCRKCSAFSPQNGGHRSQGILIRKRNHSCRCQIDLDGQNKLFTLPTSPWEGSQYKLTLVISLRAKVLLKVIFSALIQNASIGKYCRLAVTLCCKTKLRRLMKRCFLSIQFEGLSTKYIAICSEQCADKIVCKKYVKPVLDKLRFNVLLRNLYFVNFDVARRHRLKVQLRSGFDALWFNKSGRRSLSQKKRWATFYSIR